MHKPIGACTSSGQDNNTVHCYPAKIPLNVVAIAGATILEHYCIVKFLQLIWR